MRRRLFMALLAVLTLASAAPASAAEGIVVERIAGLSGREGEPLEDEGGGYPGCWRAYITAWGSHWTSSSWSHHFNPSWCGNGSVVTAIDAGWHYQTTSGFYGPNGVSRWVISGCVGCPSIRFHAQARFSFNFMGWTSYFNDDRYITLYGSNGRIGP
jgi:hypothetical protein